MAEYDSVADLRGALTSDDPDRRASAYGDVMSEDVQPSQILETPPDAASLQTLQDAGVVDEDDRRGGRSTREANERIVELLEDILVELRSDGVTVQEGP